MDAGMPMPALVFLVPMPSFGYRLRWTNSSFLARKGNKNVSYVRLSFSSISTYNVKLIFEKDGV
jgi:hypothetical protein